MQTQIAGKVLLIEETQIGTRKVLRAQDGADILDLKGIAKGKDETGVLAGMLRFANI